MDEIARKARANKAMIYYHFGTKQELYQDVLLTLFSGLAAEIERVESQVRDPGERLMAFYAALVTMFAARPVLPRLMMREVLAGGAHMAGPTTRVLGTVLGFVRTTLADGARAGLFRRADPLLVHFSMIGPILLYFVSEPLRARLLPEAMPGLPAPTPEALLAHLRGLLPRLLAADAAGGPHRS